MGLSLKNRLRNNMDDEKKEFWALIVLCSWHCFSLIVLAVISLWLLPKCSEDIAMFKSELQVLERK